MTTTFATTIELEHVKNEKTLQILEIGRSAFATGKTLKYGFRMKQLKNMLRMIDENEEEIVQALESDLRKARMEATLYELDVLRADLKYQLTHLKEYMQEETLPANLLTITDTAYVQKDPYGLVLILGAWNYPFQLTLMPLAGAIAAGNCVIIKPSECAPRSAAVMAKLIPNYLESECYQVIEADLEGTKELLKNRFDYIFATGSTIMGKSVMAAAAPFLTPVTLELGGKSPCYIDDSSNFEIAAKRILWGKLVNVGQTCIAPDYILCSQKAETEFLKVASKVLIEWYGDQWKKSPDLARIVNERNFSRLEQILQRSKGRLVVGGEMDRKERWISPTIYVDVNENDALMEDELFGPILPILRAENPEQAIKFILARPKPLALYVFSKNNGVVNKFLERTSSGGVCINDTLWHNGYEGLPFGGVSNSGMGKYHGKHSFDTFTHTKAVLHRSFSAVGEKLGSPRYPPYTNGKLRFFSFVIRNMAKFNLAYGKLATHTLAVCFGVALYIAYTRVTGGH